MKTIRLFSCLAVFLTCTHGVFGQTDSLPHQQADNPALPPSSIPVAAPPAGPISSATDQSVADTTHHKKCCLRFFTRFSSGFGFMSSTYTSTLVTPANGATNVSNDYVGNGYAIPVDLVLGIRIHSFKIGLGISKIFFHVPTLSRTPDPTDTSLVTGAPIKHQAKTFGSNSEIPLFLEYDLYIKNHFVLAGNICFGVFYHDRNAYDGTYAPSARAGTSGFSYSFGLSPSYKTGHFTLFLNPCMRLTEISYYHSSKEDLTDLSLSLGFGACYTF